MKIIRVIVLFVLFFTIAASGQTFRIKGNQFYMNDKPFQIISGEIHFQRIPFQYWKDRLLKAKAMGLNTVATYIFWDKIEPLPGKWDFTGNNDLRKFILTAKEVGLHVILRPGPYACAEWDFGGLPPWLLTIPDIKVRCMDPRYISAVEKYIDKISHEIKDLQDTKGGPVIMLQIENEYGSFGNDKKYLNTLKKIWMRDGINIPFYTSDGAAQANLTDGSIKGCAIGLDPGVNENDFKTAERFEPGVPVFCGEYYPGWLTHWGEKWATVDTVPILKDLRWLMDHKKSFNIYVLDGGTNFGWYAGANFSNKYEPDITSYDYDAPINELGNPTPKYFAIRNLLSKYLPRGEKLPDPPKPLPVISIPEIKMTECASVFNNLPNPVFSVQPKPMEMYKQYFGFILYKTKLTGQRSGNLVVTNLHDYANVYIDDKIIGTIDRTKNQNNIEIPKPDNLPHELEILVEAEGRINYGQYLIDRKGITDRVTLNGITLMNWEVYNLPMSSKYISSLRFEKNFKPDRPGNFFKGTFEIKKKGDTYLDMSEWTKGVVWVNGNNLGRYWNIGPQQKLFLPSTFLKQGKNEVVVFDLNLLQPAKIKGVKELR